MFSRVFLTETPPSPPALQLSYVLVVDVGGTNCRVAVAQVKASATAEAGNEWVQVCKFQVSPFGALFFWLLARVIVFLPVDRVHCCVCLVVYASVPRGSHAALSSSFAQASALAPLLDGLSALSPLIIDAAGGAPAAAAIDVAGPVSGGEWRVQRAATH